MSNTIFSITKFGLSPASAMLEKCIRRGWGENPQRCRGR
jgi:hypothetical protein